MTLFVPLKLFIQYILPILLFIILIPGWVVLYPKSHTAGVNSGNAWSRTVVGTVHGILFLIGYIIIQYMANIVP